MEIAVKDRSDGVTSSEMALAVISQCGGSPSPLYCSTAVLLTESYKKLHE